MSSLLELLRSAEGPDLFISIGAAAIAIGSVIRASIASEKELKKLKDLKSSIEESVKITQNKTSEVKKDLATSGIDTALRILEKNNLRSILAKAVNPTLISTLLLTFDKPKKSESEIGISNTIAGLMIIDKINRSAKSKVYLITALIVSYLINYATGFGSPLIATVLIGSVFLGIQIDHMLIKYRIKNGWYGRNSFEAKEIIEFISSHPNKDDFNGPGGIKKAIPLVDQPAERTTPASTNHGGRLV